jgi:hypothetical protein
VFGAGRTELRPEAGALLFFPQNHPSLAIPRVQPKFYVHYVHLPI